MNSNRLEYGIPLYTVWSVYFENIYLIAKWCIDSHSYWRCESFRKKQDIRHKQIIYISMFVMSLQDFD
jgi:hypothetical protein